MGAAWPGPIVREALAALEEAVQSLAARLGPPLQIEGRRRFRYLNPTSQHVQILKAVRMVSGLHASAVLVRFGFAQEVGVLFRTIEEFAKDISFLDEAHYGTPNQAQRDFVEQFFARDNRTTEEMMAGTRQPPRVPAKKKRASEARTLGQFDSVDGVRRRIDAIDDVLSGYVHGEYPHTMELYVGTADGSGERFLMKGMLGTPRVPEVERWFSMFVQLALNAVAKLLHDVRDLERKAVLIDIRKRLEASNEYPSAE
jgi:hypothetical protein